MGQLASKCFDPQNELVLSFSGILLHFLSQMPKWLFPFISYFTGK